MIPARFLAAGLLALAATAVAQPAAAAGGAGGGTAGVPAAVMTADPAALRVLIGRDVENPVGAKLGEIDDVVMLDGRTLLVVAVGGVLGFGSRLVVLPYEEVTLTRKAVLVNLTEDQLKARPAYDPKAQIGTSLKGRGVE